MTTDVNICPDPKLAILALLVTWCQIFLIQI
jgi:hypothetical protein